MPLAPGTSLGHYRIASLIGAGGMGEVYRATDTRLNRDIALKVLSADVARDAERLARFEREARLASSLNHSGIVTIHDVGREGDTSFIAMELLGGHTLRRELSGRPLPLKRIASIGSKAADGLAAAHRAGVIHRDLKPENIMLAANGEPKLVDFGLAKLTTKFDEGDSTRLSANTGEGTLLGTVSYMSPEQASGQPVDFRSDQFSLGLVLFEMATGRHPFARETAPETLAAIISDPHISAASLNPKLPESFGWILDRCLDKDPAGRYGSTEDLARDLARVADQQSGAAATTIARAPRQPRWMWPAAAAAALAIALGGYAARGPVPTDTPPTTDPVRLVIVPPVGTEIDLRAEVPIAISPSGQRLAFVAREGDTRRLYVRAMSGFESRRLDGTEGATMPFFSPDGEWLAFFAGNRLKRISVKGGAVADLASAVNGRGGDWAKDDHIVFAEVSSGLQRVPAGGGAVTQITSLTPDEISHRAPQVLDDGDTVLFTAVDRSRASAAHLRAVRIRSGERVKILEQAEHGRYIAKGRIVFGRADVAYTQAFDPSTLSTSGTPEPVLDDLGTSSSIGLWNYAISENGTLAFMPSGQESRQRRRLVMVRRDGTASALDTAAAEYLQPHVSPDGRRLALRMRDETGQGIWVANIGDGQRTRLLPSEPLLSAAWHPDGRTLAVTPGTSTSKGVFIVAADGSGQRLIEDPFAVSPTAWSTDGRWLLLTRNMFTVADPANHIWAMAPDSGELRQITRPPGAQNGGALSPNNRWVAYASQDGIYLTRFPDGPTTMLVAKGGAQPRWSRDGRELFYRLGTKMMAVAVADGDTLRLGRATELFDNGSYLVGQAGTPAYDVMPDGRFVMIRTQHEDASRNQLNLVINWAATLGRPQ